MDNVNAEFRNVSSGPTEDNLSVDSIKDTIRQSVLIEETDPKFLCCIRFPKVATYFCLESLPLRKGLFVIGILNLVIGLYGVMIILVEVQGQEYLTLEMAYYSLQAFGVVNCCLLISAAEKLISWFAKISYYWQILETLILNCITIMMLRDVSFTLSTTTVYLLGKVIGRTIYGLYIAYILYSFIILIEGKRNMNLVVYGPDLVKLMENIKKQAAAMDIRNVSLTEIEVADDSIRKEDPN